MGRPLTCGGPEFITRAIEKHDNRYVYDKVVFVNLSTKVLITCIKCGSVFSQVPYRHLSGSGCQKCAIQMLADVKRLTFEEFQLRANQIHNEDFDYSDSVYSNTSNKIDIVHKICGRNFSQRPADHLYGKHGCPHCAQEALKSNTEEFIQKAIKIHSNKFGYNLVDYKGADIKVQIMCNYCGKPFNQTPHAHLNGQGCYDCSVKKLSRNFSSSGEKEWLNSLNVSEDDRQKSIMVGSKRYLVDAFDSQTNTIYEFYGDYYHGNPITHNPTKLNVMTKSTFGELYQKTIEKETALKIAGYNVISIWEDHWNILNSKRRNIRKDV